MQRAPWARRGAGCGRRPRTHTCGLSSSASQLSPAPPPKVTVLAPSPGQSRPAHPPAEGLEGSPLDVPGTGLCHLPAPLCLGKNANVDSFFSFNSNRESRLQAAFLKRSYWEPPGFDAPRFRCPPRHTTENIHSSQVPTAWGPGSGGHGSSEPGATRSFADRRGRAGGGPSPSRPLLEELSRKISMGRSLSFLSPVRLSSC